MLPVFKENVSEKSTRRKIFKGGAKLPPREHRNGSILDFYIYCMNNIVLTNSKFQKHCEISMSYSLDELIIHEILNLIFLVLLVKFPDSELTETFF